MNALTSRITAARTSMKKRLTRFILCHHHELRQGYVTVIAERNRLREDLERTKVEMADLEADRDYQACVVDATHRFITYLGATQKFAPGAIKIEIHDDHLRAAFKHKLGNVERGVTGRDILPDPFFDRPEGRSTSGMMH